ncbi:hypothetical protein BP6252_02433 [Coleophoma cylindrospora]|uniref:Zn(2)-C6 fungal-type domain-containing protein n=1 Tax=Coleophoma cylindrospora TaxID=1849047 RepID=A0A3D8SEX5_9HELO|nr:hypothetical protein BP6252_02433 [Coleophoma cylindrospora]
MLTSEGSHVGNKRLRQRPATSCTECRRRKQKCNQARDKPCNNCLRRYPPVECVYEATKKPSNKYPETVIQFDGTSNEEPPLVEDADSVGFSQVSPTEMHGDGHFRVQIHNPKLNALERSSSQGCLAAEHQAVASQAFWGTSTSPPVSRRRLEFKKGCASDIATVVYNYRGPTQYLDGPDHCTESYWGILENYIGCKGVEPLRALPIKASRRNAELFHLFTMTLSPYITSLDGKSPLHAFHDIYLPFMLQSPLIAYTGILTAAYFQATARREDIEKSSSIIETRLLIVSLINGYLKKCKRNISDEAVAAVMAFAYNEWIYASECFILAHMNGLREMLRMKGGLNSISSAVVSMMVFRNDYMVSCAFESPLILHESDPNDMIPRLDSFPRHLDSPLLQSSSPFLGSAIETNLSVQTALVLDDMRLLTTSVLTLTSLDPDANSKFTATADRILRKLDTTPLPVPYSPPDFIHISILHASKLYTTALVHRQPFSTACNQELFSKLWMNMWRVPLTIWKQIPG